ncbi:hypothetical protein NQ315_016409 [Exocentrus adspersus]|uniref:Uncharacterized protein n=1 Tax=Exocentrus adspersus TaxID=1586481 RepID=A0AAV8VQ09_9CUCU|nr:hypothetical protein NQ315_016409 [Exocentrus adspersus]
MHDVVYLDFITSKHLDRYYPRHQDVVEEQLLKRHDANSIRFVPVACSTVTVTKCQAALRTLQAFPFFKPTCLCKEPHVDPECNSFRDFLFDHPCVFVTKKGKSTAER